MSLKQALDDLRDELEAGEAVDAAIAVAAEENGVSPAILRRSAEASFGDLETFGAKSAAFKTKSAQAAAELEQRALAEANRHRRESRPMSNDEFDRYFRRLLISLARDVGLDKDPDMKRLMGRI